MPSKINRTLCKPPYLNNRYWILYLTSKSLQGTLRDHSKKTPDHSVAPIDQGGAEANDSDSGTAIDTHNNPASYANGGDTALITDH